MRGSRVAALLRELADEIEGVAVLEEEPSSARPKAAPRRARKPRLPVVSGAIHVSDTDRAAARADLRRTGSFIEITKR